MELIVLKMPPKQVRIITEILEREIENTDPREDVTETEQIHSWLRYRLSRWNARHPDTPAA